MTGWRMGWTIAPAPLVKAMDTIQSQETSCPSSVSQAALVAALDGPQECVAEMRKEFAARRELTWKLLGAIPGVKLPAADGAFYAFFDVSAYFGKSFGGKPVDRLAYVLHVTSGTGAREPRARVRVRGRGLRADVVRHEPRGDRRRPRAS